jgi:hypothetical protein
MQSHNILYPPFKTKGSLPMKVGKIENRKKAIRKIFFIFFSFSFFMEAIKKGENKYIPK